MATKDYNFQYVPLTGRLPGNSFVKQTEQAINELAGIVNEGAAQVEVITNLANQANDNSEVALEKATEALETSSRVYITLPNLDDADDYFDSQLYYFANSYSANLPVQGTGFLEVKTNDTKTACEQVFIADSTGLCYFRHGTITSAEVGSETVYSVTWDIWSSALASQDYVQQEVNTGVGAANDYTDNKVSGYLPLSGGTMTGAISTSTGEFVKRNADNGYILFMGGTSATNGSFVALFGIDHSTQPGEFVIRARDSSVVKDLIGKPDGTLTWNGQPLLPVGIVQAFAGTTIPNGWLLCDGSAVSRTTYAALFSAIGTTYGGGNGSTTFNLPNLTNRFIQGNGTVGAVKNAGLPNITGQIQVVIPMNADPNYSSTLLQIEGSGCAVGINPANANYFNGAGITTTPKNRTLDINASRSSSVYGGSTTVQPPSVTMKYVIKY